MNDEPSSSSAPPRPLQDDPPPTPSQITARRKKNRENFNRRRGDLLDDLLRSLDVLTYAELGVVYYMDCSTPLLLLRSVLQLLYLTPKHALLPQPPNGSRFLALIVAANALCIFLHAIRVAPAALPGHDRGYLHGGLVLDFIGQKGPSSKIQLVGLDFLVLGLQIVHCAALGVRKGLKERPGATPVIEPGVVRSGQQLEDEERGVRRSEEVGRGQEVEMQRLNPEGRRTSAVEDMDLEATTVALERTDAHIFDAFNSGQIVLADLDLRKVLREEWEKAKAAGEGEEEGGNTRRNRETRRRLIERVRGRVGLGRFGGPAATGDGEV